MDLFCNSCGTKLNISVLIAHSESDPNKHIQRCYTTNCQHIYCQLCIQKLNDNCLICKRKCLSLELNSETPAAIRTFFEPLEKQANHMKKLIKFHRQQHEIRIEQLNHFNERYRRLYEEEKAKIEGIQKRGNAANSRRSRLCLLLKQIESR